MRWNAILVLCCCALTAEVSAQSAVPVQVVMPEQNALSQQLVLSGSLTARHNASLSSRTAGLVERMLVDAGSVVEKGQALLTLDTALAKHELAAQQAALNAATVLRAEQQRLVNEAQQLTARQLFPQTELELRQAALASAEAQLQQAKAAVALQQEIVARHTLTAPFSGVVVRRDTDAGEWLALGTPVLQLVSLSPLLLDIQLPQEYFSALSSLRSMTVQADAVPGKTFNARLHAAVPVADATARSFLLRLEVEDAANQLLPGSSARATLTFSRDDATVLVVPPDALLRHPDGAFSVFSVSNNKAQRHNVTLGVSSERGVEIVSGLPANLPVVIRGNETLRDGQSVQTVSADKE